MNFCFRLVCLFTTLLMATHAMSQDLSGWSDKTVCRQLLNNPDNTDYAQEADSRSLDCASGTKNSTKVDDKSSAFDGDYPFVLNRFNPAESLIVLGSGILVIQNGAISVSLKNRFLDTSSTKYYDTLKGQIDKKGNASISFDVNALNGKGSPHKVRFSGNINNLEIKGKFDDYFQLFITLSDDTSSMSSDGLTMTASRYSGYGSHSNSYGHKMKLAMATVLVMISGMIVRLIERGLNSQAVSLLLISNQRETNALRLVSCLMIAFRAHHQQTQLLDKYSKQEGQKALCTALSLSHQLFNSM